jgi:type I restriction enzyme S subunit
MTNFSVRVGDLAEQVRGVSYGKGDATDTQKDGFLPILRAGNITDNGLVFNDLVYIPEGKISVKQKIRKGDVVIAASSGSLDIVGKAAPAYTDFDGGFGAFCKVLRPNEKVDSRYFAHFFKTPEYRKKISSLAAGANINNLRNEHLDEMKIPLPPLPEQIRIGTILDQADALRVKRREALAYLENLTQSIFIEMFGDPHANPKGWSIQPLRDLVLGKPNNGIFKKNNEYGEGLPVIWVGELFRGDSINCNNSQKLLPSKREIEQYGLHHGDILFCRSSLKLAGIGYNNVYMGEDNKALFECHVIRIKPDKNKVDPEFLNFALRMPSQRLNLFKHVKTVTMTTIDQDGLLRVEVPVPPLDLQKLFTEKLKAIWQIKAMYAKAQLELDALFTSLQHRAFHGEI